MKDVLVLQIARFGDLLQTRRLILSLAASAKVHMAVDESLVQLARLAYPNVELYGLAAHGRPGYESLAKNERVFAKLRAIDFCRVYNCNFSGMTSAICRLFDSEKITGYRPSHNSLGGNLRSPWARAGFKSGAMRGTSPLNLVDFWGWFTDFPITPESVNPPARAGGKGIGIALAGREQRRSLPVSALAEVVNICFRMMSGPEIRLFGTQSESARARQLQRQLAPPAQRITRDLCGKTDWNRLVDELSGLDLLLTPDTGLMHLGACLGVPVIAFFLSSAWCHETGPYGIGHRIFQAVPSCAPCLESGPCNHNLACHDIYKSGQFLRAFSLALAGKPVAMAGLQFWQSGFDDFGAKLKLLAGTDPHAGERARARSIIKQMLEQPCSSPQIEDQEYEYLLNKFVPDSEWMLPPWRYC